MRSILTHDTVGLKYYTQKGDFHCFNWATYCFLCVSAWLIIRIIHPGMKINHNGLKLQHFLVAMVLFVSCVSVCF